MEKIIPYEKLSKKEKRKIDQSRRQLNPATRKPTKQQGLQHKEITGMKAGTAADGL